jgi:hypothetical protein
VGFVVDSVALGQVFVMSASSHRGPPYIIWGMDNMPVGGYSSETQSRPIDVNNDNNNMTSHNFI